MCLLVQRWRDAVMMMVVVVVRDMGMVVVMMRYLGMWHRMLMMVVVMVMVVMRYTVIRCWCNLPAGCPHFVFPRGKRLVNGRDMGRRLRGMMMMVVVMMVMVMVRQRRWCLVVMLIFGYRIWLARHLISRSWNRYSVRLMMIWHAVRFFWYWCI